MVIVTTIIQSGFTVVVVRALRRRVSKELTRFSLALDAHACVLWLFLATILEVWTWALLDQVAACGAARIVQ